MVGVFEIRLVVKKTREILTYNFVIRQRTFSATTFLLKVEPDEYFFMLVFFNSSELWKNISYRRLNFWLNVIQRRTIVTLTGDLSCSYLTWFLRIPPNWMSKRESKQQAISGYLFRLQHFSWPALVLSLSLSDSLTSLSSTRLRLCHHTLHNDHHHHHHHHLSLFILNADLTLPQWE